MPGVGIARRDVAEHLADILGENELGLDPIPKAQRDERLAAVFAGRNALRLAESDEFHRGARQGVEGVDGGSRRPRSGQCRCGAGRGGCRRGSGARGASSSMDLEEAEKKTSTGAPLAICCASAPEAPKFRSMRAGE